MLDKIRLNSNKGEGPLLLSKKFSPPFEFPRNIYEDVYIRVNSRNILHEIFVIALFLNSKTSI
jgi:hypothetical protein